MPFQNKAQKRDKSGGLGFVEKSIARYVVDAIQSFGSVSRDELPAFMLIHSGSVPEGVKPTWGLRYYPKSKANRDAVAVYQHVGDDVVTFYVADQRGDSVNTLVIKFDRASYKGWLGACVTYGVLEYLRAAKMYVPQNIIEQETGSGIPTQDKAEDLGQGIPF